MLITVFTPTYNRGGHHLNRVYHSLIEQTDQEFCWLIVDDGSVDETKAQVEVFMKEANFKIRYIYQENQGKMQAINTGVKACDTELFLICDSDDWLLPDAIEALSAVWKEQSDSKLSGILAYRDMHNADACFSDKINRTFPKGVKSSRLWEIMRHGVFDTTDCYRTDLLRKYPFPKFAGEKFVPEMAIWLLIDMDYERLILPKTIEEGEYQVEGYSRSGSQFSKSPQGYAYLFLNKYHYEKKYGTWMKRIIEAGKCMALCKKSGNREISKEIAVIDHIFAIPVCFVSRLRYRGR